MLIIFMSKITSNLRSSWFLPGENLHRTALNDTQFLTKTKQI